MADKRLIGEDASLSKFVEGTLMEGDASTIITVKGTIYKIAAIAETDSAFPTDFVVGDYYYEPDTITLAVGDNVYPIEETVVTYCKSWAMTVSSDETETTVLRDTVKKYRKGKTDVSGTITGIMTTDDLKTAGAITNRFFKVITVTSGVALTNADIHGIDKSDYFIKAYLNDSDISGDTQAFLLAQIELLGSNLGAEMGSAQEWSSDIRMVGNDPVLYTVVNE